MGVFAKDGINGVGELISSFVPNRTADNLSIKTTRYVDCLIYSQAYFRIKIQRPA
jgi:hypothetical protein